MITKLEPLPTFLGLITNVDASQVPFGGAVSCKNLAQFNPGRLRRIPGIVTASAPVVDSQVRIPLSFLAEGLGASGADQLIAIFMGAGTVSVVNLTTGSSMSGPALAAPVFDKPWSATFYNNKWMFAGGGNTSIYQLDSASAYSAVVEDIVSAPPGSQNPPGGNLIKSFLNRLYIADLAGAGYEGLVVYSDSLSTNFQASSLVNVKEIAGKVTALAVNSTSTDAVGIDTFLVIAKQSAIWVYNEQVKKLVTSAIGITANSAFANTPIGSLFLGNRGSLRSVFLLPLGTAGEPIDISETLRETLNGASPLVNEGVAHAVYHDKFYKLFYSTGAQNTNQNEIWLDLDAFAREQRIIWYGVHSRGTFDSSAASRAATGGTLDLFSRGAAGAAVHFQENTNLTSGFVNSGGVTLVAELDLPLNVPPFNDEKIFDLIELQIAKEANISGNVLIAEPIADDDVKSAVAVSVFDASSKGISRVAVPMRESSTTGMAARNARLRITQTSNARLDMLGASVQYLVNEDEGGGRVRSKV